MSKRDAQERFGFLRGGTRPPLHLLIRYIDRHRDLHGVEPICRALTEARAKIAPSMRACNVAGAVRGRVKRTTILADNPAEVAARPGELLERDFTASAPNQRWVADITYVATSTEAVDEPRPSIQGRQDRLGG